MVSSARLAAATALAPLGVLYGILFDSWGALALGNIFYAALPLAAAASAAREGLPARAWALAALGGGLKLVLLFASPDSTLHYAADSLAAMGAALVAVEQARGSGLARAGLLATIAGAGLTIVKIVPIIALSGLALEAAGLAAAGLAATRGQGRASRPGAPRPRRQPRGRGRRGSS